MANPRKSQEVKLLQGTFRPCREKGRADLKLALGIPEKPSFLQGEASRAWDRIAQELYDAGILTKLDRAALTALCLAYAEVIKPDKLNQSQAITHFLKFCAAFGMTPASRACVSKAPVPESVENPFTRFTGK